MLRFLGDYDGDGVADVAVWKGGTRQDVRRLAYQPRRDRFFIWPAGAPGQVGNSPRCTDRLTPEPTNGTTWPPANALTNDSGIDIVSAFSTTTKFAIKRCSARVSCSNLTVHTHPYQPTHRTAALASRGNHV